jgi:hypothetical protein
VPVEINWCDSLSFDMLCVVAPSIKIEPSPALTTIFCGLPNFFTTNILPLFVDGLGKITDMSLPVGVPTIK